MADFDYSKTRTLENYIEAMNASKGVIDTVAAIKQPEPVNVDEIKTMCRNQIIAGSTDKAAFFGTITTLPTVTAANLQSLGMTAAAAAIMIAERDRVRELALSWIS